MVQRGTTKKRAPNQSLTLKCPVRHCGESLDVTWCKLLAPNHCDRIKETENIEITQDNNTEYRKDQLISYLTFKQISVYDDGLYRCELTGSHHRYDQISHTINISVSDNSKGVEDLDSTSAEFLRPADDEAVTWRPYLFICAGIALLVATLTAVAYLRFYNCKGIWINKPAKEMSTHMIPDLPKSPPSTPVLQAHFSILNDLYSPSSVGTQPAPPCLITNGNQPLANSTSQGSDSVVYTALNHKQSGKPARKQHIATKQESSYATISVF
uniref:B- and T-lymphocyte attenuator isoform X2 n=1 Tax=Monopterus albus TaxID=43700 RepID=UPI0009B4A89D|nr:B- and T-lymphocyte attenuator isoform X2 [Monopterus albus]